MPLIEQSAECRPAGIAFEIIRSFLYLNLNDDKRIISSSIIFLLLLNLIGTS